MSQLQKKLNLYGLTMIAVGACIGSGIFVTPYQIIEVLPHAGWVLVVWSLGGLIALTGALTFAELGALFPQSGGVYVFLKEAYGPLAGFLYGWVILLVINTGALAALSLAFAEYLTFFIPDLSATGKLNIGFVTIIGLTLLNCFGVQISQVFANLFTGLKLLALVGIVLVGFFFFSPETTQDLTFHLAKDPPQHLMSALLLALIGVLWSFGGWHHASYLAGETIEPQRTLPRAMILATVIVTTVYVLTNLAYMLLLPLDSIAQTERVAGDALASVFSFGSQLVTIMISISIFGTIGIYTMSAPRIYYAMAKDRLFFPILARVSPRYHTPIPAMLIQAVWALVLLAFWGTFHDLITYVTFMDLVFMTLAGLSIFIFRKKLKDTPRVYRAWGYPWVPLLFVLITTAFVINTLIERPEQAQAGLVILLLGVGVFYFFRMYLRKDSHAG